MDVLTVLTAMLGAGGVLIALVVVVLLLVLVWILLPFALFGVKPLLRRLLAEQQRTNELLQQVADARAALAPARRLEAQPSPGRWPD